MSCAGKKEIDHKVATSILLSSDKNLELFGNASKVPLEWSCSELGMVLAPLAILRQNIRHTTLGLSSLINRIEQIEKIVESSDHCPIEVHTTIQSLHSCNTSLIKLERRWRFESILASSIREFIDTYKKPIKNHQDIKMENFNVAPEGHLTVHINYENQQSREVYNTGRIDNTKSFRRLDSDVSLLSRLSRGSEYDLGVLPRRIQNQFTAVGAKPGTPIYHSADEL